MRARIPCINPACRRTASSEKFAGQEIVCSKCWKLLPAQLAERYRLTRRRARKIERCVAKRQAKGAAFRTEPFYLLDIQIDANWRQIREYFLSPPAPTGLENFLKETGLA